MAEVHCAMNGWILFLLVWFVISAPILALVAWAHFKGNGEQ